MLYDFLINSYKTNQPIFVSDIELEVSPENLRQMFKNLCDSGKIKRFDTGIYYLPKESRLKGSVPLGTDEVLRSKYVERNGKIIGYYTGYTFANQLGLTTQVPYEMEIASNNASARVREVSINDRKVILRRPRCEVTGENYKALQLLDLLGGADKITDSSDDETAGRIRKYVTDEGIKKTSIDECIGRYPDRVYRSIYEMRLYDVFA